MTIDRKEIMRLRTEVTDKEAALNALSQVDISAKTPKGMVDHEIEIMAAKLRFDVALRNYQDAVYRYAEEVVREEMAQSNAMIPGDIVAQESEVLREVWAESLPDNEKRVKGN